MMFEATQDIIPLIEQYELTILHSDVKGDVSFSLLPIGLTEAFKKERRKIYVVKNGNQFLYVGEANTSIKVRLQRGFISHRYFLKNDKARGGYKGYQWISDPNRVAGEKLSVFVAVLEEGCDGDRAFVEAVEGELVYLIRHTTNYWPTFQNEIHFNNRVGAIALAHHILRGIQALELDSAHHPARQ